MDTEFYVNPDVGKILLVMMTSKKTFQRIVLQCGQQRPPKKSPYQLENCTFLHRIFKNFDKYPFLFAE